MAKKKVGMVKAERLDPPMTRKERTYVNRFRTAILVSTAYAREVRDPGVGPMADEISAIYEESVNRIVLAYRSGKEE